MSALREGSPVVGIWWLFVLRGVLAGVLGITALLWPTLTIKILVLLVGAYLIADGVMGLVVASRRAATPGRWVQPAVSASIGLLLVFWPGESATTLFVVLGAAALFLGISQVITARRFGIDTMDRRLMTTAGAAAAILGVILIVWPGVAVVTLSWIIAACALLVAAVLIFLGVRIKQARVVVEEMPPRGPTG
ncbi:MAG: DUF308 domain-containing protein [Gammaproteobacteria bacterium]|nr:DUF308 domain-containing protein [Gammaproteobacteria bacterium]MDX2459647.1 DUF308 domain-containing protein [Gammaproteobacteria bacterium]